MHIAKLLASILALAVAGVGTLGVVAPSTLLEFGRALQTTNALYVVAAVRVFFGAVLWWASRGARMPKTLRVLGAMIIVAGVLSPFLGVERTRAVFDWWSTQGPLFTRTWAMIAIAFGLFVLYAVASPRTAAAWPAFDDRR